MGRIGLGEFNNYVRLHSSLFSRWAAGLRVMPLGSLLPLLAACPRARFARKAR